MEILISVYAGLYRGVLEAFVHFIVSVGCVIFFMGIFGMVPGVRRWLEQLVFPVFLAFTFWGGLIIFGVFGGLSYFYRKLIPVLNIFLLKSFITCVEIIRVISRPLVIRIRLLINIVLGTTVIYILGSLFVHYRGFIILIVISGFLLYEIGVCFFQSYIFRILLRIYIEEVEWK